MRKIERNMLNAIRDGRSWQDRNSQVIAFPGGATVLLHGHHIATVRHGDKTKPDTVEINLCGWNTPTTRSRLSALLRSFVNAAVATKLGRPYVVYFPSLNEYKIASDGWHTCTINGVRV